MCRNYVGLFFSTFVALWFTTIVAAIHQREEADMTDTTSRESVIDKIKALFERTTENGCTEAEAIAAALMAQRLIVRYDVTDAEGIIESVPVTQGMA